MVRHLTTFSLGFLVAAMLFLGVLYFSEVGSTITGFVVNEDVSVPDRLVERDILVYQDRIIIYLENATISNYGDSGSMKPTFDDGANGIRVKPSSAEDLSVGDIITFRSGLALVVHRIVDVGIDEDGVYYITKGDNNRLADGGKVGFDDIEYVTVGVLW